MIPRQLEPEVMDQAEEAQEYNQMDHGEVNQLFVTDLAWEVTQYDLTGTLQVLDVGTGTALIPIELCRQSKEPHHIVGIDLAKEMLKLGERNVEEAKLSDQISLKWIDAKQIPEELGPFDVVISNSIVHHIPDPADVFREMVRVLKPGGLLFVRDLLRPESEDELMKLVEEYTGEESFYAQKLFANSLHAALTLSEVNELAEQAGIDRFSLNATSDRHWTLSGSKSAE